MEIQIIHKQGGSQNMRLACFAIKYFYNHFNISPTPMVYMKECGYGDTIFQNLTKRSTTPSPTSVEVTSVTLPKDHFIQFPWKYVNVVNTVTFFQKLEPKVMDP